MIEKFEDKFSRYEIARIIGARSLQLSMDAPILLKLNKDELFNFDTLKIAEKEFEEGILPITVKRPLPERSASTIKKLSEDETKEKLEKKQKLENKALEKIEEEEKKTEEEIKESGEIMEMANPEDETETTEKKSSELV